MFMRRVNALWNVLACRCEAQRKSEDKTLRVRETWAQPPVRDRGCSRDCRCAAPREQDKCRAKDEPYSKSRKYSLGHSSTRRRPAGNLVLLPPDNPDDLS